jgi:uncharacterized RDD family membrane protein YckC
MSIQLNRPSISEIRAEFISEQLKHLPQNSSYINVFVTGRSTSGKTTLGNKLIGEEYFLSTGRRNTTQSINLIDFSGGLRFFDLPGVDGGRTEEGGRLENYNRTALGMRQVENYSNVSDLSVLTYRKEHSPQEHQYSIAEFQQLPFKADLVLYIIAPTKQVSNSEKDYAIDLLDAGYNVIFVLNMFGDQQTGKGFIGTQQNIEDAEKSIQEIYRDSQIGRSPVIAKINCFTGEGIEKLLDCAHKSLGKARGDVFSQLISMQYQKSSQRYVDLVKKELLKVFVDVACFQPKTEEEARNKLVEDTQLAWDYLASISIIKPSITYASAWNKLSSTLEKVIKDCKEDHYEDVLRTKSKKIYENVPVYKDTRVLEDDLNNPIMKTEMFHTNPDFFEGIGNLWNNGEWKTKNYRQVHTGKFEKKWVTKQVFDKYVSRYSRTDTWTEPSGKKKYSFSTYKCLGMNGVNLLKTLVDGIVHSGFQDKKIIEKSLGSHSSMQLGIDLPARQLNKGNVNNILSSNTNLIFDSSFDSSAKQLLVEGGRPTPRSVSHSIPQGVNLGSTTDRSRVPRYNSSKVQSSDFNLSRVKKWRLAGKRCFAFILNLVILAIPEFILWTFYNPLFQMLPQPSSAFNNDYVEFMGTHYTPAFYYLNIPFTFLTFAIPITYFTIFHSSPRQSTWAERYFGICITNSRGGTASFWQSMWRTVLTIAFIGASLVGFLGGVITVGIGIGTGLADIYVALLRLDGRCLHDILSGTRVVER